ncbi:hypothetical protein J7J23_00805 [bacterium]|nr:hypothetical protein [bacterium]
MPKRLIIIDSNSLLHRAWHALPPLRTKKGELINACYGFALLFLKAVKELKPDFVVATFDSFGPTFRHKEFKEYKAKRKKAPKEFYDQIPKAKKILNAFGVPVLEKQGFEADDLIGTVVSLIKKDKSSLSSLETIVLSGDLDMLQLVDGQTKVYAPRKGIKDTVLYDKDKVSERYDGLSPSQLLDFKALAGDVSDNIPGVPGIGKKTAILLIKNFGRIEELYSALENNNSIPGIKLSGKMKEKLLSFKKQAFLSKELAKINREVKIDFDLKKSGFWRFDKKTIKSVLDEFEFYGLSKRIDELFLKKEQKKQGAFFSSFNGREDKNIEEKTLGTKADAGRTSNIEDEIDALYKAKVFSKKVWQIEKKLIPIIRKMERNGILVDAGCCSKISKMLNLKIKELARQVYDSTGIVFNINSPAQLSEILFSKLKIPVKNLKKTSKGMFSTNLVQLKKLKSANPVIGYILEYKKFFRLKTGFVDKLIKMVNKEDRKIHPKFKQIGSDTGRIVSFNPNLQNVPKKGEIGKEIRKCFKAEKGFELVSFDYSQVELRIIASLSSDKEMLQLFKEGKDVHTLTAAYVFGVAPLEITEKQRETAKVLNYGILYGISPSGFSEITGLSIKTSEKIIKNYLKKFSGISRFIKESIKKAKDNGFSETIFGRRKFLPDINSENAQIASQQERIARNFPVQGSAADIIKTAMVRIEEKGILTKDCKLLLQIHDELLFEISKAETSKAVAVIKTIMENVVSLKAPLCVNVKKGNSWGCLENMLL